MATPERASTIVQAFEDAGVQMAITLPDFNIRFVLDQLDENPRLKHVRISREEEGVGIATGALLTGCRAVMVMQNAGFLNSCNAIVTTAIQFGVPLVMLIYYAGDFGDAHFHQLALYTEPVLAALDVKYMVARNPNTIATDIARAVVSAEAGKRPVALLLTTEVL